MRQSSMWLKNAGSNPARHRGVVQGTAVVALVVVGDIQLVGDVEVQQDALQLFRGIANEDLFVGMSLRGDSFGIVATHTEEEKISLGRTCSIYRRNRRIFLR